MPIVDDAIRSAAEYYGIDPNLLAAQAWAESTNNPNAVSKAGAQGLMQIMPGTAAELGVKDPFDPWQSAYGGANYLSQQMRRFGGDLDQALAAYNAGPGNVQKYGGVPPFKETQEYVRKIKSRYGLLDADPVVRGSAPRAFISGDEEPPTQFPQGQIPVEQSQLPQAAYPEWRKKIAATGESTTDKIGEALGAFDFKGQVDRRNEFAKRVSDYYRGSDEMGAMDVPGAVLAAPVNLLKNVLSPIRRALGNRQQVATDAMGGPLGADLIATATGDPSLAGEARETPGATDVLRDLFTDARERRAQAVRASLSAMGAFDRTQGAANKNFLSQLGGLNTLSEALASNASAYGRLDSGDTDRARAAAEIQASDFLSRNRNASAYATQMGANGRAGTDDAKREWLLARAKEVAATEAAKRAVLEARAEAIRAKATGSGAPDANGSTALPADEQRRRATAIGVILKDLQAKRITQDAAKEMLRPFGYGVEDTWWGPGTNYVPVPLNGTTENPPSPSPVVVPTGNVGGATAQQNGTLTSEQAAAREAGEFDPNAYSSLAEVQAALKSGRITRSVAEDIAGKRGWIDR